MVINIASVSVASKEARNMHLYIFQRDFSR